MVLQTDNGAVALAARLLGASAPHLAQQYIGQIEMFFGAMAWYLDRYPRHAAQLLADLQKPAGEPQPFRPTSATNRSSQPSPGGN